MALSSSEVSAGSEVGEQLGLESGSGFLHQRVTVAAAFEDAGFHTAGAVRCFTGGDLFQQAAAVVRDVLVRVK
ncbi:MAG: hypothetical protein ACK5Q5_08130 [Planctomycetaceae bacterium]